MYILLGILYVSIAYQIIYPNTIRDNVPFPKNVPYLDIKKCVLVLPFISHKILQIEMIKFILQLSEF